MRGFHQSCPNIETAMMLSVQPLHYCYASKYVSVYAIVLLDAGTKDSYKAFQRI